MTLGPPTYVLVLCDVKYVLFYLCTLQQKLGAEIWEVQNDEWKTTELSDMIHEGEEFWIKVKDFQSENVMASFFDFCPYITKENGLVILKDTLCFKQKGFICQLIE